MFETLIIRHEAHLSRMILNRSEARNAINGLMLREIARALDGLEAEPGRLIVIQGNGDWFCTGMDLSELAGNEKEAGLESIFRMYQNTLQRLTIYRKVVVSLVEGPVLAGGVGLAAASDLVVATRRASFALPEAVWGLLPAMVLPYLIRRTGFQRAYAMTLTTQTVSAAQARDMDLVDYLCEQPEETLNQLAARVDRVDTDTILSLKLLAKTLANLTPATEERTLAESIRLAMDPKARCRIRDFVQSGRLPWEETSKR
jgi:polyketide biosynthesis enoyl-CoA hydratase PksH